jgi:hypothetical protein
MAVCDISLYSGNISSEDKIGFVEGPCTVAGTKLVDQTVKYSAEPPLKGVAD